MGLFDIFKKNANQNTTQKCSECFQPIKGYVWQLNNRPYCQECYNRKMAIVQQTAGQAPEEYDFEMTIEGVFLIKNHGVVVTGKIHRGVIHRNDTVFINGANYTVTLIDVIPNQVEFAKEGANVRLLLSTMNADLFKRGDVVTSKRFEDTAPKSNTFVCDACGKELPIKYRHWRSVCAECYATKPTPKRKSIEGKDRTVFYLGTFDFSDEERQKLRDAALRYMPPISDTVESQLSLLNILSSVMMISVVEANMRFSLRKLNSMPDDIKKNLYTPILIKTILVVNQTLSSLDPDSLVKKVDSADAEDLLKAWIVLDYYNVLRPESTTNIQHFRDYIHNVIQTKFASPANTNEISPIKIDGTSIYFDSNAFSQWKAANVLMPQYEFNGVISLSAKEPTIYLYEDGLKTREYVLQTEEDEDFTNKYFLISVRLGLQGNPSVPVAQIDGFISDTPEERKMTLNDIGYRFEGHFLACGGDAAELRREMNRGQDLPMKGLKYQGYTTPSNIRLIGICPECEKSFCFHGYAFYMAQSDVAYSDDGLDCCEIQAYEIDKESWSYETEGKVFRYYNSFCCPHCGTPYIDYKKHPENKVFSVSGCVHLGRKYYQYK